MSRVVNEVFYRDFDLSFQAHPITGKLIIKKNSDSVKQAFKLLIMTNLYERPYRPRFGSNVPNQLFELYTPFVEDNIRNAIETAAANYEKRIEILDIRFFGESDRNELGVTIIFRVLNTVQPTELTINLARVR